MISPCAYVCRCCTHQRQALQVRFVQADAVRKQLNGGHIVLLGNLAYSAAGEVLNCDCYSVATQAAIDLQADKLFCITTPSLQPFDLPQWLPISDAEQLLQSLLESKDQDATAVIQQSGWPLSVNSAVKYLLMNTLMCLAQGLSRCADCDQGIKAWTNRPATRLAMLPNKSAFNIIMASHTILCQQPLCILLC